MENNILDSSTIITKTISLDELNEGLELLRKQQALKIMIDMDQSATS